MCSDDLFTFAKKTDSTEIKRKKERIKILTVDDEKIVHKVTNLVLSNFEFNNSKLDILNAYNIEEAKEFLHNNEDIALVLLDIIMETDDAGLRLVKYIREKLGDKEIRIVIRTGETGGTSEEEILKNFDIDDYKEKSDLSNTKLFSTVHSALKSYTDIQTIKETQKKLREKELLLLRQSKMIIMGEMIENIAHQWRQPLSLISTIASGIQLNKENGLLSEDTLVKDMQKIMDGTEFLTQTIDDFRDFYKPNKVKESFSIKSIFEKIFKIIKHDVNHFSIDYVLNIDDVSFYGFKNDLMQVLINILNNAKDQLSNSNNKSLDKKLIIIDAETLGNEKICISIKDNAGGIKEENLSKVFDAYFTTKEKEGTGIGLYISRDIINTYMHGDLSVKNDNFTHEKLSYKGAKFTILI